MYRKKSILRLMILSTLLPWFERGNYALYFWGFWGYIYSVRYLKRYLVNIYPPNVGMDLNYGLSSAMISF